MAEIVQGDTLNWSFVGSVLIAFQVEGKIDAGRWAQFVHDVRTNKLTHCLGGAWGAARLSSVERGQVTEILKVPMAVIVNHPVARGVLTAMGWLGMSVKGFAWDRVEDAVEFLGLQPPQDEQVILQFRNLVRRSLPPGHPGLT